MFSVISVCPQDWVSLYDHYPWCHWWPYRNQIDLLKRVHLGTCYHIGTPTKHGDLPLPIMWGQPPSYIYWQEGGWPLTERLSCLVGSIYSEQTEKSTFHRDNNSFSRSLSFVWMDPCCYNFPESTRFAAVLLHDDIVTLEPLSVQLRWDV